LPLAATPRPNTTPKSTTKYRKSPASKKRKRDIFSEEESEAYSVHDETEESN
jgi:hypothetical protein